ncbi:MAG TPA: adenylate/guanylate cyclase domain-containing protein [Gallionella sp.]|nr:adenylate/guanylate cyclase domain-containing protein [Gallionella sp.]
MKKIIDWLRSPIFICFLLGNLVFISLLGVRELGGFHAMELMAYDLGLRLRPAKAADERVVLIAQTEEDIHRLGFPVPDGTLAQILERLTQYQARAIGVDIYRDIPVPPGEGKLNSILQRNQNILWVTKYSEKNGHSVAPPKVIQGTDQVGFNDMIDDPGGIIRRGLLFMDDGQNVYYSFPLQIALRYLQPAGIGLEPDPQNEEYLRLGRTTIPPFQENDGGYVNADAAGYQFLLDYQGMPHQFKQFTFSELLAGKVDPSFIKDKIVIIGTTAKSLNDYFYTPFSQGLGADQRIFGIELHGQIVSQIIRFALDADPAIKVWDENTERLWIWFWTILGALVGFFARALSRFTLAALGVLGILTSACYFSGLAGWWIPAVPPALGYLVAATVVASYMSNQEKMQRAVLMQLFSKHVSKDVAEAIWHSREQFMEEGRPRSQKLVATVLFTDLQGFTTISEKLDPETLMGWLNEYMEAMAQIVIRHHGVINKYIGDAIMAIYGIPFARSSEREIAQDAENAVNSALAMREEIVRLNRIWAAQGKATIAMRVGIYTGPLVAGSLGSTERLEYTVIGDTVNIASRLESFDKSKNADPESACRILIGGETLKYLGDKFITHPVGAVALKGKDKEIDVYQVIGNAVQTIPKTTP